MCVCRVLALRNAHSATPQTFLNRFTDDVKPPEFEVALDDVYNINVSITTGVGRLHDADTRTTGTPRSIRRHHISLRGQCSGAICCASTS